MIESPPASDTRRLPLTIAAALMVIATIALYWPAIGVGFLGDDFMILHRLRGIERATDVIRFFRGEFFEYYRPLAFVTHAIDWSIAGQNARQFHFTNLLIHLVSTILVLLIGRSLSPRPLAGLLAAALFAFHASNNEAVVWMSARFDLLATCFALAALYWFQKRAENHPPQNPEYYGSMYNGRSPTTDFDLLENAQHALLKHDHIRYLRRTDLRRRTPGSRSI